MKAALKKVEYNTEYSPLVPLWVKILQIYLKPVAMMQQAPFLKT